MSDISPLMSENQAKFHEELAESLLEALIHAVGRGFHPETPGREYVSTATGHPTMSKSTAELYDKIIEYTERVLTHDGVHARAYDIISDLFNDEMPDVDDDLDDDDPWYSLERAAGSDDD